MTAGPAMEVPVTEAIRNRALLFLARNPNSMARCLAEANGLSIVGAKSLLRILASRGEVISTRVANDVNRQRVYLWSLAPQVGLIVRILDALDAPRMVWGVAKDLDVPEQRVEMVLVLLATDGVVRESGGMWARVQA